MPVELVAHRRPDRAGAAAVDDTHLGEACERSVVDERAHGFARLLRACATHVELVRDVAARAREHRHRRLGRVARPVGLRVGLQARERDAYALAAAADHLRLVAVDVGDGAAEAERRSRDGIADRERSGHLRRLVQRAERFLGSRGTRRRGAETPVALALRPRGRYGSVTYGFPLAAARLADLIAQPVELGARRGEVMLGFGDRLLARLCRRSSHLLQSRVESVGAALRLLAEPARLLALDLGGLAALDGVTLGRFRFRKQLGDPEALGRDAPACIRDDGLVEAEALGGLQRV